MNREQLERFTKLSQNDKREFLKRAIEAGMDQNALDILVKIEFFMREEVKLAIFEQVYNEVKRG